MSFKLVLKTLKPTKVIHDRPTLHSAPVISNTCGYYRLITTDLKRLHP